MINSCNWQHCCVPTCASVRALRFVDDAVLLDDCVGVCARVCTRTGFEHSSAQTHRRYEILVIGVTAAQWCLDFDVRGRQSVFSCGRGRASRVEDVRTSVHIILFAIDICTSYKLVFPVRIPHLCSVLAVNFFLGVFRCSRRNCRTALRCAFTKLQKFSAHFRSVFVSFSCVCGENRPSLELVVVRRVNFPVKSQFLLGPLDRMATRSAPNSRYSRRLSPLEQAA